MMHGFKSALSYLLLSFALILPPASVHADYVKDAQQYYDAADYKAAVIQLKNALQQNPDNSEARYLLGLTYLRLEDGPSAVKELVRARDAGMDRKIWLVPLGKAYLLSGMAKELLSEVVVTDADDVDLRADVLALQANAYIIADNNGEAERRLAEALKMVPGHGAALLGKARLAMDRRDYKAAEQYIQDAKNGGQDDAAADILHGELLRLQGKPDEAIALFNKALSVQPENATALMGLAASYLIQGDLERSDGAIATVRGKWPNHPLVNYLHALSMYQKDEMDSATESLQRVFVVDPEHLPSLLLNGTIAYRTENYLQAEESLARYIGKQQDHLPAIKLLAAAYLQLSKPWMAIDVLEKGRKYANNDPQYDGLLGSAYLRNGDYEKAVKYLEGSSQAAEALPELKTQIAISYLLQDKIKDATDTLKGAVDIGGDTMQVEMLLAMLYMKNGQYDEARATAEKLISAHKDKADGYNLLGIVALGQNDKGSARIAFDKALTVQADFTPALMNLARLETLEGNLFKAEQRYKQVLEKDASNLTAMIGLAQMSAAAGNQEGMLDWLDKARKANPGAIEPSLLLVDHYLKQDDTLKALDIARQLQANHPDVPGVLAALGLAQMQSGIDASAETSFRKLVELMPNSIEANLFMAKILAKRQNVPEARKFASKLLDLQPRKIEPLIEVAAIAAEIGDREISRIALQSALTQFPNRPEPHVLQGDAQAKQGEYAAAAASYAKAGEISQSSSTAIKHFNALQAAGDREGAFDVLEAWLKTMPDDKEVRLVLASALHVDGQNDRAREHYTQLLQQDRDHVVTLNNLAWLLVDDNPEQALGYAERAYLLAQEKPEVIDTYGWMLLKAGRDVGKSINLLKEASLRAPHITDIRYHLAVALQESGNVTDACQELRRINLDSGFSAYAESKALMEEICN